MVGSAGRQVVRHLWHRGLHPESEGEGWESSERRKEQRPPEGMCDRDCVLGYVLISLALTL